MDLWVIPYFIIFTLETVVILYLFKDGLREKTISEYLSAIKFNHFNPIPHVSGPEVPSLTLHPYTGRMGLGVCSKKITFPNYICGAYTAINIYILLNINFG